MCCLLTLLVILGPRVVIVVWWILNPAIFNAVFSTILLPVLGIIFLPWTTLVYVYLAPFGIVGIEWMALGLGVLIDIVTHGGGFLRNRDRLIGGAA